MMRVGARITHSEKSEYTTSPAKRIIAKLGPFSAGIGQRTRNTTPKTSV